MNEPRLAATLRALGAGGVEFILVGGLAAVLNGAPINTFDIDIVHSRAPENITRLLRVLESLDAIFRLQPERRLRPSEGHLAGSGYLNLITQFGLLDVLCSVGRNLCYEDLLPHSVDTDLGEGMAVRVLDLETLIALKEKIRGEKDLVVLPILRRTLEERRKQP